MDAAEESLGSSTTNSSVGASGDEEKPEDDSLGLKDTVSLFPTPMRAEDKDGKLHITPRVYLATSSDFSTSRDGEGQVEE